MKNILDKFSELGIDDVQLELTNDLNHGDLTTNVALQHAKDRGMNPRELATDTVSKLGEIDGVEKIEVAGPGFINFYLDHKLFTRMVTSLMRDPKDVLNNNYFNNKKIMLEYTTQNVLKQFHLGHLMSNTIGLAIANLLAASGAEVKRDSYQGDVGMHIAKALWGLDQLEVEKEKYGDNFEKLKYAENPSEVLGIAYARGEGAYIMETQDGQKAREEIKEINKAIYDQVSGPIYDRYLLARQISLDSYQKIYDRLGVKLDFNIFESETAKPGMSETNKALEQGILVKSDGAIMYQPDEGEKLIPVVFINSEGYPIYAAKDLGLVKTKKELWDLDQTFVFTASEQNGQFAVVKHVLQKMYPDQDHDFLTHIGHGYLTLKSGKMSSREGNVLTADEALDQIKIAVIEKMSDRQIVDVQKELIAEDIAQAAVRFTILKGSINRDVVFDFSEALSFEGATGPYLQYSAVRLRSIIEKAHASGYQAELSELSESDIKLVRQIYRLPSVIKRSAVELAPQLLVTELLTLAKEVNGYYVNNKVINESNVATTNHRLAIVISAQIALEYSLNLLGIKVPTEM